MADADDITPVRLNLRRDKQLEIDWADGRHCVYSIGLLRTMCPCAKCREIRNNRESTKRSLQVLPGNFQEEIVATGADLVGNYAIRIAWSDAHDSGIYSFRYLRDICPE